MECILVILFLVAAIAIPLAQMLLRKNSPNHWRKLLRLDLAALIVITTGFAIALAAVRGAELGAALCVLTLLLPMSLAFAWLARYVIEDLSARRTRRGDSSEVDLTFLTREKEREDEVVQADVVDSENRE